MSLIDSKIRPDRPVLYLNITITDGKEAVQHKVGKEVAKANLPPALKMLASKAAPKIASDLVKGKQLATQLSRKMVHKIPKKLRRAGMLAVVEPVFQEGPYVVLQLQIQSIDAIAMAEKAHEEPEESDSDSDDEDEDFDDKEDQELLQRLRKDMSSSSLLEPSKALEDFVTAVQDRQSFTQTLIKLLILCCTCFFYLIGSKHQRSLEHDYLPKLIQSKMSTAMTEMLQHKMEQKRMQADAIVLSQDQQARYFYAQLQRVRQSEQVDLVDATKRQKKDIAKDLTPTRDTIKKKLSDMSSLLMPSRESDLVEEPEKVESKKDA